MLYYNKLLEIYKDTRYPFNLIQNLKNNIINTKNEIELEYVKDLNTFKDTKTITNDKLKSGGNQTKKIYVYEY